MKTSALAAGDNVVHLRTRSPVQGIHLLGEWYGCPRSEPLRRAERLRAVCLQIVRESSFDVMSAMFQQFEPEGAMGAVLLTDAHLAIHTWPDTGFVAVDFYACYLTPYTRGRAHAVFSSLREVLRPVWVNFSELSRGVPDGSVM
jgi:S-adenosylmethionine decarboxylase proenzyme